MAGQVYAVASGKGGVGKTTTVVNLGVVLRRADHTVVLVDGDLGMANLATMLGVEAESTIHDVLAGEATVEEALVEEAPGFAVLAGSDDLSSYADADPGELHNVLEALAEEYEFVLVDTGAGMSHEDVLPLGLSDRVVLVTTPEPASIGDTRKTADLADLAAGAVAGLVVTMADDRTDAKHVAREVGVDLLGVVPYDPTVRDSTASATPLEALNPDGQAAEAYRDLAETIADEAVDEDLAPPGAGESAEAAAGDEPAADPAAETDAAADAGEATGEEPESTSPEAGALAAAEADASAEEAGAAGEPDAEAASADAELPPDEADAASSAASQAESDDGAEADAEAAIDGDGEEAAADEAAAADSDEVAGDEEDETAGDEDDETAGDEDDETAGDEDDEAAGDEDDETAGDEDDETAGDEDDETAGGGNVEGEEPDEEEDYLAEFEDDEPTSSGGILARLGRLFR